MTTPHPETGRFAETFAQMGEALDEWLAKDRVDALRAETDWQGLLATPVPQRRDRRRCHAAGVRRRRAAARSAPDVGGVLGLDHDRAVDGADRGQLRPA